MSRFHAPTSASVIGLPSLGPSWATAAEPNASARQTETSRLRVDMFDRSIVVDAPTRDAVVVLVRERQGRHGLAGFAARGHEFRAGRLHVAGFVPGPALQHGRSAIPTPRHPEAGKGLRHDGT